MTASHWLSVLLLSRVLSGCASGQTVQVSESSRTLFDNARQRHIPVELYVPSRSRSCSPADPCQVAIVGAGYGISHTNYSFIASALNEMGYLVVAVQHELSSDPSMPTVGDVFTVRKPNWQRGAANLRFVIQSMRDLHPEFDWQHPVLIGHSNGGDISAWFVRESPDFTGILVTLDNRRVPLPRASVPRVLSVRATDFVADTGVLPSLDERRKFDSCIVTIARARHDDMHDGGPVALKNAITRAIVDFLRDGACGESAH